MKTKVLGLLALTLLACDVTTPSVPAPHRTRNLPTASLRQAAARHEGGHAAFALMFSAYFRLDPTKEVRIDTDRDRGEGSTEIEVFGRPDDPERAAILRIAFWLAGEASEELLQGRSLNDQPSVDVVVAGRLARQLLGIREADVPPILAEARALARDALALRRTDLERLADALHRKKSLTANEAAAIFNAR